VKDTGNPLTDTAPGVILAPLASSPAIQPSMRDEICAAVRNHQPE